MNATSVAIFNNMSDDLTAIIIVTICVLGPIWLIGQIIKSKAGRNLNAADIALVEKITGIADRMETRMTTLERILDADSPTWRQTNSELGGKYERKVG
jgi:phage shock protein B